MRKLNKIRGILAIVVIAAASYLVVAIAMKFHRVDDPGAVLADLPKNIDVSLRKVHYTNTKEGTLQWDLVAGQVDYYHGPGIIRFTAAEMVLHGKNGSGGYTLKADSADYFKKTGDVRLAGNVSAVDDEGMRFETDHVVYRAADSLISSSDHVRLAGKSLTVEGTGIEIRVASKTIRVLHNVTATVGARKN
jgi:LPS export ABC transporter protein LptC